MSDTPLPEIAGRKPIMLDLEPGEYLWCACGKSKSQPFCDGSHAGGPFVPVKITVTKKTGTLWLCTCKRSRHLPHCDGAHNKLPPLSGS